MEAGGDSSRPEEFYKMIGVSGSDVGGKYVNLMSDPDAFGP